MHITLLTLPILDAKSQYRPRTTLPSLGIYAVDSALKTKQITTTVFDAAVFGFNETEFFNHLQKVKPEYLGVSVVSGDSLPVLRQIWSAVQKQFPEIQLLLGGPQATIYPDELVAEFSEALVISGEIEAEIDDLYTALCCHHIGLKRYTTSKTFNLDKINFPDFTLAQLQHFRAEPFEGRFLPVCTYLTSRGCPYSKCTFCQRSGKFYRKYQRQSVEKTISDLKRLKEIGLREVIFYDDEFFVNKTWHREFCQQMKALKLGWTARARASMLTLEMLQQAKEAGCHTIEIGFESANQHELDLINKQTSVEQNWKATKYCQLVGIDIVGTFIFAFPKSTKEDALRTLNFAKAANLSAAAFIPYHPFPGTILHAQFCSTYTDVYASSTGVTGRQLVAKPYVPEAFGTEKTVFQLQRRMYLSFYLSPKRLLYFLLSLRWPSRRRTLYAGVRMFLALIFPSK